MLRFSLNTPPHALAASLLMLLATPALPAEEDPAPAEAAPAVEEVTEDPALAATYERIEQLEAAAALRQAELQERIAAWEIERAELAAAQALAQQKLESELAALQAEQQRLETQELLAATKRQVEQAVLRAQLEQQGLQQQALQSELSAQQHAMQMAQIELETERIVNERESIRREAELKELRFVSTRLETDLDHFATTAQHQEIVTTPLNYEAALLSPEGYLRISDRRISLNGPIIYGTADYIEERINFFSNKNPTAPIFLVIDNCPGGSVMEGDRILRAMAASQAPVYVVLRGFAASMAAVIATEAERSFALANSLILHHQPWTFTMGNVAQQSEQLAMLKEWARRLHSGTAAKMNLTLEAFYERMYQETVTGDWEEFGDTAIGLNWVTDIVPGVREEGIRTMPTGDAPRPWWFVFFQEHQGNDATTPRPHAHGPVALPKPLPFDAYFIYNPDRRYTW